MHEKFKSLNNLLVNLLPEEHCWKIKLFKEWNSIVGSLKNIVTIEKIDNDFILLGVPHPSWAQELYFMIDILKNKINTVLQEEKIKTIKFKTGVMQKNKTNNNIKKVEIDSNYKKQNVSVIRQQVSELKKIKDSELKNALEEYFLRCSNLRK